jgi:formate-dependent nitrite reductase membrane component NrfD
VSGSAVVTLIGGPGHMNFNLSRVTLWLLVIYGLSLLIHMMVEGQGSKAARISVQRLIKGNLFFIFMIGVIAIGLVVPFVLLIMDFTSSSASMLQVASGLILIGGILMRYSLIASGVKMPMLSEDSISATYWMDH